MERFKILMACLVTFAGLCSMPDLAHAKRGIAIVNTGEDVFEAGPIPEQLFAGMQEEELASAKQQLNGWQAGYKCSIFGVFWVYFHTWDCKPVIFSGETFDDSPEVAQAVEAEYKGSYSAGFWKGYMRFVLLALILGGGVLYVMSLSGNKDTAPPEAA